MLNRTTLLWKVAVPVVCLALGTGIGLLLRDAALRKERNRTFTEKREGGYRFINPLLECEGERDLIRNRELRPFQRKLESYLRDRMRYRGVAKASVYFRELNDGIWFSLGETERFTPASMRKVPMMIAAYKQAEREPEVLRRNVRLQLKQDYNMQQAIRPSVVMTPGREYTIEELVRRMIVYSDNNAFMLLSRTIDPAEIDRTYTNLNMPVPGSIGPDTFLTVQTYASFFRILYNATYLGKELSERSLAHLALAEFTRGIVAGVPRGIPVAHKFGEKRDDATGKMQLHDCGIVYHSLHPYLLCVMTEGTAFEFLDDAIASISKLVYDEVNAQFQGGGR